MPVTAKEARKRLKAVGRKRDSHRKAATRIQRETADALESAKGVVSITEAAELVGLNRSTVYEVYGKR